MVLLVNNEGYGEGREGENKETLAAFFMINCADGDRKAPINGKRSTGSVGTSCLRISGFFMLAAPFRPSILLTAVRRSTMVTTRGSTRAATSVLGTSALADSDVDDSPRPAKRSKTITTTDEIQETTVVENSAANKRKNTSRLKDEPMPEDYRARVSSEWKVGAHVSSAGGVENAIQNAAQVG